MKYTAQQTEYHISKRRSHFARTLINFLKNVSTNLEFLKFGITKRDDVRSKGGGWSVLNIGTFKRTKHYLLSQACQLPIKLAFCRYLRYPY